ncbi:peptidase C15 [Nodosilinea sp. LEGE 06152]|uniref:pyroglutamyl-peptidase I family protein n=1 Tax=Nodosilinea sp. LEGE 06152 TaxID=2777966 RepID=UPI00187F83C8|nr:peptidase C15 [Nodosilinea sp. LEGE 06152]
MANVEPADFPIHPSTHPPIHPSTHLLPMLLTTFAPWRAHQPSNAADDLVAHLQQCQQIPSGTTVLRHIPVSFELAPIRVMAKLVELQSPVVVCCGMAEGRSHLHLERYGKGNDLALETLLPLEELMAGTHLTGISDCAGTYVCNHLYYRLLGAIAQYRWPMQALFVHVPPLTSATQPLLAHDLALILKRLAKLTSRLNLKCDESRKTA